MTKVPFCLKLFFTVIITVARFSFARFWTTECEVRSMIMRKNEMFRGGVMAWELIPSKQEVLILSF